MELAHIQAFTEDLSETSISSKTNMIPSEIPSSLSLVALQAAGLPPLISMMTEALTLNVMADVQMDVSMEKHVSLDKIVEITMAPMTPASAICVKIENVLYVTNILVATPLLVLHQVTRVNQQIHVPAMITMVVLVSKRYVYSVMTTVNHVILVVSMTIVIVLSVWQDHKILMPQVSSIAQVTALLVSTIQVVFYQLDRRRF